MAGKSQINMLIPDWRLKQIDKRAAANHLNRTEYLLKCVDLEESISKKSTIIITSPERQSEKTLKQIILGE